MRWLVLVMLVGCEKREEAKPSPPPPPPRPLDAAVVADAAADATPVDATVLELVDPYDAAWGECDEAIEHPVVGFDRVELVDCITDPPADPDKPRNHMAHLVLRRNAHVVSSYELGEFVRWEEGTKWLLPGLLRANGRIAALALRDNGSMGPDSGSATLHVVVLDGGGWRDIHQIVGAHLDLQIAPDGSSVTVSTCHGPCDSDLDHATLRVSVLTFDGRRIAVTR